MKPVVVQKYGGATLADPSKIKQVAERLAHIHKAGKNVIVVVSAMGGTTNELISLAKQISKNPKRRELDMLLSTGERVSMSLLSIALNDLHCQAISFTGSQAGILTNDSHLNAQISDVKSPRVQVALEEGKIVVLAGFQGVSPVTKEITTLGRGGTDITAVAIASAFRAERCEILKDVDGVYNADPKIISSAKAIANLNHRQLMEMTFWGAKVLNYRSVELAFRNHLPIFVGPAEENSKSPGTLVISKGKEESMFESNEILSINSHDLVLQIECTQNSLGLALAQFEQQLERFEIASPQILNSFHSGKKIQLVCTGPEEMMTSIQREFKKSTDFKLNELEFSSLAVTCTGTYNTEMPKRVSKILDQQAIAVHGLILSPMSVVVLIERTKKDAALKALHGLAK